MTGQFDMFSLMEPVRPGEYVTEHGRELSFDEAAQMVGRLAVDDVSTESHAWYQVVRIEEVIRIERGRRLICYHGTRQRAYLDEIYFAPRNNGCRPTRLYERSARA